MAKNYREISARLTRTLREAAEDVGVYDQPGSIGEARELFLNDVLRDRVPRDFGVAKVEVLDSSGGTASEYDVAIFEETFSALHVSRARRIVRVEAIAALVEVKSNLKLGEVKNAYDWFARCLQLRRHYQPTKFMTMALETERERLRNGLLCGEDMDGEIPSVLTVLFGFTGPSLASAMQQTQRTSDVISVLGEYTLARKARGRTWTNESSEMELLGTGDAALPALLSILEDTLRVFSESRMWVRPDTARYLALLCEPTVGSGEKRDDA